MQRNQESRRLRRLYRSEALWGALEGAAIGIVLGAFI